MKQNDMQSAQAVREAVAWALHLADSAGNTLLAVMLADILDIVDSAAA